MIREKEGEAGILSLKVKEFEENYEIIQREVKKVKEEMEGRNKELEMKLLEEVNRKLEMDNERDELLLELSERLYMGKTFGGMTL